MPLGRKRRSWTTLLKEGFLMTVSHDNLVRYYETMTRLTLTVTNRYRYASDMLAMNKINECTCASPLFQIELEESHRRLHNLNWVGFLFASPFDSHIELTLSGRFKVKKFRLPITFQPFLLLGVCLQLSVSIGNHSFCQFFPRINVFKTRNRNTPLEHINWNVGVLQLCKNVTELCITFLDAGRRNGGEPKHYSNETEHNSTGCESWRCVSTDYA